MLRIITSIIAALIMVLIQSCSGSNLNTGGSPQQRYTTLSVWEISKTGEVSSIHTRQSYANDVEIGVILDYALGAPGPGSGKQWISLYEIDFGDGTGWHDVTTDASKWGFNKEGEPDPQLMTRHNFENPGEYVIRGKITYWDGDVHLTSRWNDEFPAFGDKSIIILSPEEAAP